MVRSRRSSSVWPWDSWQLIDNDMGGGTILSGGRRCGGRAEASRGAEHDEQTAPAVRVTYSGLAGIQGERPPRGAPIPEGPHGPL